jgi:3-methyl-2-oxobutanoate hydroxymethyltransferase
VVADLPFGSYQSSPQQALESAARFMKEAGAHAVKLEGGRRVLPQVETLVSAGIPVMGHLGLTPQSIKAMGGFKVQAKAHQAALDLMADAKSLAQAGCFAIVLEGVPDEVARMITDAVSVPTIGIGAGPSCDGQVLVFHDVLGLQDKLLPKFVRRYANQKADAVEALTAFASDVRTGRFPAAEESYHLADDVSEALGLYGGASKTA